MEYSSSEFFFFVEVHGTHPSEPLPGLCVVGGRILNHFNTIPIKAGLLSSEFLGNILQLTFKIK